MTHHPWQYDESIQKGTDYSDENEVVRYDARMRCLRDISGEIEGIRSALELQRNCMVLEIGTGTGELALGIAPSCAHVYAVDVSPAMLRLARQKASTRGIANVTFLEGGFLNLALPPTAVDAVVSQFALHHLPDFWKAIALAEIRKVLKTDGRVYLKDVVYPSAVADFDAFFSSTIAAIQAKAGEEVAQRTVTHIQDEFSTLDWILEGLLERAGFRILQKSADGFIAVYLCEKQ